MKVMEIAFVSYPVTDLKRARGLNWFEERKLRRAAKPGRRGEDEEETNKEHKIECSRLKRQPMRKDSPDEVHMTYWPLGSRRITIKQPGVK